MRVLVFIGAVLGLGFVAELFFWPHYAAPATGLILILLTEGMRHLRAWRWRKHRTGLFLARSTVVVLALMLAVCFAQELRVQRWSLSWCSVSRMEPARAEIASALRRMGGRHLIVVSYRPTQEVLNDWVYNSADIDSAPIVWARDLGPENNCDLLEYFHGRQFWQVDASSPHPRLTPYALTPGSVPCPQTAVFTHS
jgi:hypothetical protein